MLRGWATICQIRQSPDLAWILQNTSFVSDFLCVLKIIFTFFRKQTIDTMFWVIYLPSQPKPMGWQSFWKIPESTQALASDLDSNSVARFWLRALGQATSPLWSWSSQQLKSISETTAFSWQVAEEFTWESRWRPMPRKWQLSLPSSTLCDPRREKSLP